MKDIVSHLLPLDKSLDYIGDILVMGGASKNALSSCGLPLGCVRSLAPKGTSTAALLDFAHGGLLDRGPTLSDRGTQVQAVPTTITQAASIVSAELMACAQPELWIHEPLLTTAEVMARGLPYKTIGEAIYLVFRNSVDAQHVEELLRYCSLSWHFLAFVTESRDKLDTVDELVCTARFLLIGAYDGESYLYAERVRAARQTNADPSINVSVGNGSLS